ncbi:unnamed protein product [Spirodela intermedia]|uniref:MATH domain-containing protein n=1 Tax=Spirodela intermedia TaxID=51605 RepID=A0A7I8IY83_SPIIN|nr:unnamed protein product [Spirodela intermedia]CAA6662837.1 unnamed protein product [Spirodela intermedia]
MGDSTSEDCVLESQSSSVEVMPSGHRCISGDSHPEWRSSEQVENGNPSTSPSYWDTDDDSGFSQISKRELRSNVFEVGGYKWYVYFNLSQGCDVCNHLSLFLCVANHDKLLPGWSHFAQFTIAVVNKDSKKSKYSDTLHRFWKKEHDWGWKSLWSCQKCPMGFLEKAHHPFRCLDCQYRRELVRVYLSNVEQLCRRYVEEKRGKFIKIIEDKVRWSSFHDFWLGTDHNTRRRMSRDKSETILKVVVKHFFIENEVTSTLVMDYLYSGLKALEMEEMPEPFVLVEKDVFVLTEDVLLVLERAALEPLPPKEDKGSQNQNRRQLWEDLSKDSIERDERRLTELGRRTVEIFALNHIYSMIEVAYQEAVALRRQEELIREEEAAGQAENELRSRRIAAEKEKRMKKKQKKGSRKGKDKGRCEKSDSTTKKLQEEKISAEVFEELPENQASNVPEKVKTLAGAADGFAAIDDGDVRHQPDSEEREASPTTWDTDASEVHHAVEPRNTELESAQTEKKSPNSVDDSSSTCSTDSVLSIVMSGPHKGTSPLNNKISCSRSRRKNQRFSYNQNCQPHGVIDKRQAGFTHAAATPQPDSEAIDSSMSGQMKHIEKQPIKEEVVPLERKHSRDVQVDLDRPSIPAMGEQPSGTIPTRHSLLLSRLCLIETIQCSSRSQAAAAAIDALASRPQPVPVLSRSVSAAGRLGIDPSLSTHSHVQSYRNAIMGITTAGGSPHSCAAISAPNHTSQAPASSAEGSPSIVPSVSARPPEKSTATEQTSVRPELTFGSVTPETLQQPPSLWPEESLLLESSSAAVLSPDAECDVDFAVCGSSSSRRYSLEEDSPASSSAHQLPAQGVTQDEFPHIDIINDLLDEEHSTGEVDANGYPLHDASAAINAIHRSELFNLGTELYERLVQRDQRSRSLPQFDLPAYMNSQIDGPIQKQWPLGVARPPVSLGTAADNEYSYHQDYLNLVRVLNGYNKYHRANGH